MTCAVPPSPEIASVPNSSRAPRALLNPPGGVLMWIVVALELAAFGVVFVFVALRAMQPGHFINVLHHARRIVVFMHTEIVECCD